MISKRFLRRLLLILWMIILVHARANIQPYAPWDSCSNFELRPIISYGASTLLSICRKAGDTLPIGNPAKELKPRAVVRNKKQPKKNGFLFRSILTKYNGERGGNEQYVFSRNWAKRDSAIQPDVGIVQQICSSLGNLYYLAYADTIGTTVFTRFVLGPEYPDTIEHPLTTNHYGKYWNWVILHVHDSSSFLPNFKTFDNLFNYTLIVPDIKGSAAFLQKAMQNDLANYFGYHIEVRDSIMPYYALERKDSFNLYAKHPEQSFAFVEGTEGARYTSAVIKDIFVRLLISFSACGMTYDGIPFVRPPFVDETGFPGKIDYDITYAEFNAMQNADWNVAMSFLDRLELKLVLRQRITRVVVVSDPG